MIKRPNTLRKLSDTIDAILKKGGGCHLTSLRFAEYKNIRRDEVLPLDFPITVLLGKNGTNKSSILHALYGGVKGKSIGEYWFETQVDTIPPKVENNGVERKQSVVYEYLQRGQPQLYIKARAPRKDDPEYWEPVKPTRVYGFPPNSKRVPPVDISVLPLDFRSELPVFDKYFYFPDEKHLEALRRSQAHRSRTKKGRRKRYSKQQYVRNRSGKIKKELLLSEDVLTTTELEILSFILGRQYVKATFLKHHHLHGHSGWAILFTEKSKENSGYSDAFAGSGESAAALLVRKVSRAATNTLVLLDEPETSLHPQAQQRVLEFLASQVLSKSLQVVIATHSIHFATGLPQPAIRVLQRGLNGRVEIKTDLTASEALHEVADVRPGRTIIVEDVRAESIVRKGLARQSVHAKRDCGVRLGGGVSQIFLELLSISRAGRKDTFVILDGDHRFDRASIPDPLPNEKKTLTKLIDTLTRGSKNKHGQKSLPFQSILEMQDYVEFLRDRVFALPADTPEELVWDRDTIQEHLKVAAEEVQGDYKSAICSLAEEKGYETDTVFDVLATEFWAKGSANANELAAILAKIRHAKVQ